MTRLVIVTAGVLSSLALAQPKVADEKKAVSFNEIERGFFLEARAGLWALINPPIDSALLSSPHNGATAFSAGQAAEFGLGFDIGDWVSVALSITGTSNRMSSTYLAYSGGIASGDLSAFIPGAGVKVRLLGLADAQGVRRTWLYVKGAAGLIIYNPHSLFVDQTIDLLVSGGLGVEYFTKLRHFSVGLEASFNAMLLTAGGGSLPFPMGFSLLPTLKYSF